VYLHSVVCIYNNCGPHALSTILYTHRALLVMAFHLLWWVFGTTFSFSSFYSSGINSISSILRFWDPRANTPQQGLHDQIYAIDHILPQDNMLTSPCVVSHFLWMGGGGGLATCLYFQQHSLIKDANSRWKGGIHYLSTRGHFFLYRRMERRTWSRSS